MKLAFTKSLLVFSAVLLAGNVFAQQPESYTLIGSGHVNDYANVINHPEEDRLLAQLKEYQEKTSIEIAVVTVPSLGGMSIEEFTNRLANHWGVGDRQKDNGLVLLIAPVEGELRIEVGDGLQGDLSDGASGALLDRYMMPILLRIRDTDLSEENAIFTEAVVAGVGGVISYLGNTPYAQRLEERRLDEEKAAEDTQLRAEQTRVFIMFAVPAFVALAILGLIAVNVSARRRHVRQLQELFSKNGDDIKMAKENLTEAAMKLGEARQILNILKLEHPRSVWEDIESQVAKAPIQISEYSHSADELDRSHLSSTWHESENESRSISAILTAAVALAGLTGLVKKRGQEISEAKIKSPEMANEYNVTEQGVAEILQHKDVKDSTKQLLMQAREKYNEAIEVMKSQDKVNWLGVYALLTSALALLGKVKSSAQADKNAAEEVRRPRPVYHSPSSSSSRRSTFSSGSRSSSGGSRIGGGGRFSGGGASRGFRR